MLLANTVYSKENTCVGQWCLWSAGQEEWQAAQDPGQGKKASGGMAVNKLECVFINLFPIGNVFFSNYKNNMSAKI